MTALGTPAHVLEPPPAACLDWARRAAGEGARVVDVMPLVRSRWHANHIVRIGLPGEGTRDLILRRWARPGWEAKDPDFDAAREAAVLRLLEGSAVPAPRLVAADAQGAACDVPALLITRLPGEPPGKDPDAHNLVTGLARALRTIHEVGSVARDVAPRYRSWHDLRALPVPGWTPQTETWGRLLRLATSEPPQAAESFIHRDFHHGNTLWSGSRLTGVVDWTTGSWGPIAVDVAHARWNLAIDYGPEFAAGFLEAYRSLAPSGYRHEPYWDAAQVLDAFGGSADPPPAERLDRLERYLADALAA